ncbi:MAG: T9SS type A sorting domain-containing protein [Crocinitomicaceae bacterium]|nr:T9SS type A sorting domain-containing protein [Crocinitomicaceae bacterium]
MKKFGLLLIALIGYSSTFYAQQGWCGTDAQLQKTFAANPELINEFIEHNIRISSGQIQGADRSDPIIIPVVVHVIHDNSVGNISYDQILSGIDMLNVDYNRLNADTVDTRNTTEAPFEPLAVSFDISFALAKLDPDGNCTNGVERRNSPGATYNAGENAKYYSSGGLDAWPRDQYLNIWIVNSIENDGTAGVTLGYAQFPQFADDGYGVIIRHDSYGTVGTASGDRTLTHEVGHCLGLLHTFQGPIWGAGTGCHSSDCGAAGDFICDTPPATEAHWSCPAAHNSCTSIPTNDPFGFDAYDQWENYMSYAPCQNMFSQGQYDMVSGNLTDINFLADLVSLSNQTATGVLLPEVLCEAAFYSDRQTICAGETVNFFDDSYFNVTGWTWTFTGGTASSTTDQNPSVVYNTPGTYDVTLQATDGISNVSTTLTDYIMVLPDPGDLPPYKESFEQVTTIPDNDRFFVMDGNGSGSWELTNSVSYYGDHCVYINNHGVDDQSTDELISGTIDLSGVDAADDIVFTFRYAYRQRTSADDEWLRFYVSKDCGETWSPRKNIHGATLADDQSPVSASWAPAATSDWVEVSVTNITTDYYVSDFRFKFTFENDGGNNFYLDYINMYPESMTGLINEGNFAGLSVYPNPASDQIILSFNIANQSECSAVIIDAMGNIVGEIFNQSMNAGNQQFVYNTSDLSAGVYFIQITGDQQTETLKLILE